MDSEREQQGQTDRLISGLYQQHLIGMSVVLFVEALIWGLLSFFLPDGWWHLVINIGAFLITLAGVSGSPVAAVVGYYWAGGLVS